MFNKNRQWMLILSLVLLLIIALAACGPAQEEEATAEPTEAAAVPDAAPEIIYKGTPEVTSTGLEYVEVEAGDGPVPQAGNIVTMHFSAAMSDGTVIADSAQQGGPITAVVGGGQLFPGWEEGLGLMREGGKSQLIIPSDLIGEAGLPAGSTLVMDVDLIDVSPPPEPEEVVESDLITTESGLQYFDLVEGDGDSPTEGDKVTVNFTIWVEDETQFIVSSEMSGQPLTYSLGDTDTVFPGWDEGVSTMKIGGKRQLIIPPDLALGEEGTSSIPANSTLVMEVELVSIIEPVVMTEVDEDDYEETDSGLKYYDLVIGTGPTLEDGQRVEVHYTGWLTDGTQFDSSVDRGQTFVFTLGLGEVIPGWDEGVVSMNVGGKRQLVIPAELGYGEFGSPPTIPPNATLIFEIEVVSVVEE